MNALQKALNGGEYAFDIYVDSTCANQLRADINELLAQGPTKTLRDEFAAAALQGIEASQGNGGEFIATHEKVAKRAYALADAMLEERSKK